MENETDLTLQAEGAEFAPEQLPATEELLEAPEAAQAEEEAAVPAEAPEAAAPARPDTARSLSDFARQVQRLCTLYPDFREMPEEVARAVGAGEDLLTAYTAYRTRCTTAAAQALEKENAVLRHNAAAAARAPVTPTAHGGAPHTAAQKSLLRGFEDDTWS